VRSARGVALQGLPVTFSAPADGPSGTFGSTEPVMTDALGIATASTLTANAIQGTYNVIASAGLRSTSFAMTNAAAATADLAITKTDGLVAVTAGGRVTYTITASNAGPGDAPGTLVADVLAPNVTATWTCVGTRGGTCKGDGNGDVADTVDLPAGSSVTYTLVATLDATATGTLVNTATVTAGAGVTDPNPGNNSATDTNTIAPPTYDVTGIAAQGGTIVCVSPVARGNTTTCTATPDAGRVIATMAGCGGGPGAGNPYTTGPVTAPCTVTVVFDALPVPALGRTALALLIAALMLAGAGAARMRRRML